jgi:hypothetical protein
MVEQKQIILLRLMEMQCRLGPSNCRSCEFRSECDIYIEIKNCHKILNKWNKSSDSWDLYSRVSLLVSCHLKLSETAGNLIAANIKKQKEDTRG